MNHPMRIGQLAKAANINIETVRFYERKGLIPQPVKPAQGYRDYPQKTLDRILFIKRAQKLGFTLNEISDLLIMEMAKCSEVKELASIKRDDIRAKIADLKRMETALAILLQSCETSPDKTECPIIKSLIQDHEN